MPAWILSGPLLGRPRLRAILSAVLKPMPEKSEASL